MDDSYTDLIFVFGTLLCFLLFPFCVYLAVTSAVAWTRTREWRKQKSEHFARLNADVEMDGLIAEDEESEEEPLDSEDEAEINARKEEQAADWELTTHQKFRKEWNKIRSGAYVREAAAKKEREQRAQVAKDVARELLRAERKRERRAKKTHGKAQEALENSLPTYDVATASSS